MPKKTAKSRPQAKVKATDAELSGIADSILQNAGHGEGVRDLVDMLSVKEREFVYAVLAEWEEEQQWSGGFGTALWRACWERDYHEEPVSIETFIDDKSYLGRTAGGLEDVWKQELAEVFGPGSEVCEWLLGGAIGTGKTTTACVGLAYQLYMFSLLKNPHVYYGLNVKDSLFVFGVYSVTLSQVADTGFYKLRGMLDQSPYFRYRFPRKPMKESEIEFKRSPVKVMAGSRALHAIGKDLYSCLIDEANFMEQKASERGQQKGQAWELYEQTVDRIQSRFMEPGGRVPGIVYLISSKTVPNSFLEQRKDKANPRTARVTEFAHWDVWRDKLELTGKTFKVRVGDRYKSSKIFEEGEEPEQTDQVIDVPVEYRERFTLDVDQAIRNVAGESTMSLTPLIYDRQSVLDGVRDSMSNPFHTDAVTISHLNDDNDVLRFLDTNALCVIRDSKLRPKLNPNSPRFVHADLALTGDCAGLAVGHVSSVKRMREGSGRGRGLLPFVVIDMMVRIWPPETGQIDIDAIRQFVMDLGRIYPVKKVTCDGWQSVYLLQLFHKQGYEAEVLSMDRKPDPYLSLRGITADRRIAYYRYQPYINEVLDLEFDREKNKVDHPDVATDGDKGRKDVADAVAGVVYNCLMDQGSVAPVVDEAAAEREQRAAGKRPQSPKRRVVTVGGREFDMDVLEQAK